MPTIAYFDAVRERAEDLDARLLELVIDYEGNLQRAEEDLGVALMEIVDSYVVYDEDAVEICALSNNFDAFFDEIGAAALDPSRGFHGICNQLAFWAMRADIMDRMLSWDEIREQYLEGAIEVAIDSARGQYALDAVANYLGLPEYDQIQDAREREDYDTVDAIHETIMDHDRVAICDGDIFILREEADPRAFFSVFEAL